MSAIEIVAASVAEFLRDEVVAESVAPGDDRVSCVTPLYYPSGDAVVVWVTPRDGGFELSDYGEGYEAIREHPAQDRRALIDRANAICGDVDVSLVQGRVVTKAETKSLGDAAWRVASASSQIAQLVAYFHPRRRHKDRDFAAELASEVQATGAKLLRDEPIVGKSGHRHRASIFVPSSEIILEPVGGQGNWSQVAAVYMKFGDLEHVNGYHRLAVVDDRREALPDDFKNLLVQVGDVVDWTARALWLPSMSARHSRDSQP